MRHAPHGFVFFPFRALLWTRCDVQPSARYHVEPLPRLEPAAGVAVHYLPLRSTPLLA